METEKKKTKMLKIAAAKERAVGLMNHKGYPADNEMVLNLQSELEELKRKLAKTKSGNYN